MSTEEVTTLLQRGDAFVVQLGRDQGADKFRLFDAALGRLFPPANFDELKRAKRHTMTVKTGSSLAQSDEWFQPIREVTADEIARAELIEFVPASDPVPVAHSL